jgi:hypothetical protein
MPAIHPSPAQQSHGGGGDEDEETIVVTVCRQLLSPTSQFCPLGTTTLTPKIPSMTKPTHPPPSPSLLTSTRQQLEEDCRPDHRAEQSRGALIYLDRRQRQRRWCCVVCCVWCAVCCVLCVVCCVWCAVCGVLCVVCCVWCAVCGVVCGRETHEEHFYLSFFLFQGTGHSRASFLVVLVRS